ncbi:Ataxin-10 [Frankliniella fusca]|uniref:Ataxin-10 n=1 Tax=Frankliniella fusca TaxID=407009 RepID=A0AAE1HDC0_9NEOP|nr:Ataxin-10 [Frankliniella fusca]
MPEMIATNLHAVAGTLSVDKECIEDDLDNILTSYRTLRNGCAGNQEYQTNCTANASLLDDTLKIMTFLLNREDETSALCVRVATQFLGNLIVNHSDNQLILWDKFSSLLKKMLASKDVKLKNFAAMVMYNILLGHPDLCAPKPHGIDLLATFLKFAVMDSEFGVYATELFLSTPDVFEESYPSLDIECRLRLLEVCHDIFLSMPETSTKVEDKKKKEIVKSEPTRKILMPTLKFMVEQLKRRSFLILKTSAHYADSLEPREVSKLIEVVACASSKEPYITELQSDKSLLIDCNFLLKSIHMAGQAGDNDFSPIHKLSELNLSEKGVESKIEQHPAFGFKACLVRLLGNLCWRHRENQDQVRELDGIPLLLDCCSIDARNPLMIQWVVLAIRNLCENNKENQCVIATMSREGTIDTRMLHDLGLTIHGDEKSNKVRIVPLKNK